MVFVCLPSIGLYCVVFFCVTLFLGPCMLQYFSVCCAVAQREAFHASDLIKYELVRQSWHAAQSSLLLYLRS